MNDFSNNAVAYKCGFVICKI